MLMCRFNNLSSGLLGSLLALSVLASVLVSSSPALAEKKPEQGGATPPETPKTKKLSKSPGGYVHNWIKFPGVSAKSIFSEEIVQFKPEYGYVSVVVFMASWCERCQSLMTAFEETRGMFKELPVRTLYVFAHDTLEDAQGFAREHKVQGASVLGNYDILKSFHNPALPTIYIGDRHGWLMQRMPDAKMDDVVELRRILKSLTSI